VATATALLTKGKVTELVQMAYLESERDIQPMAPFILIRTLPRATISSGGIILPEKQNKPNSEAVVLRVYEPYWEKVESRTREDGKTEDISVWNECDVHVGDHIIFPHHCGLPDSFLDEREYRLIREDDAIATLHYRPKGWLRTQIQHILNAHLLDEAGALMRYFDITPKEMSPKTKSGV
jgi:co-chaperonin GroES (HSP10)